MQPDSAFSSPTLWVAIYAALVSTLTAGWTIFVALRDRADVRVTFNHTAFHHGPKVARNLLGLNAQNRGRRPVMLSTYGFIFNDGSENVGIPYAGWPLPHKLEEGASYTNFMPLRWLQESIRALPEKKRITAF